MSPYWAVVRSQSQRERFASEQLGLRGFETFLPLIQTKRASAPLFNGYFFVRIVEQWRSINYTFGVLCLVRVGDCPSRMPDAEVDAIRAMIDGHGFVKLPEAPPAPAPRVIRKGAKIRVISGPLTGFRGLYVGQTSRARELVLLNLLGGPRTIPIPSASIALQ